MDIFQKLFRHPEFFLCFPGNPTITSVVIPDGQKTPKQPTFFLVDLRGIVPVHTAKRLVTPALEGQMEMGA